MTLSARHRAGLLVLTAAVVALGGHAPAQPAAKDGYTPVVSAAPLKAAGAASLKALADWFDQKDYVSAVETNRELVVLAQLLACQSGDKDYRDAVAAFRADVDALTKACRDKDDPACRALHTKLAAKLDKLPVPPGKDRVTEAGFKPAGSTKTWMLLLDSAYAEAKRADKPADVALLAEALAEEANAAAHLRGDARWRKTSLEVRDEALNVAKTASAGELVAARAGLKKVYQACEACHQGYKR